VDLAPTAGPGAASELANKAASKGSDIVLVCGGDGTINEVINGLVGSQVALGLLPGGTANILARDMGLPLNPVRAATELSRCSPRRIPLGKATWYTEKASINGAPAEKEQAIRYFMTVAGIGFDAHVVYKLSPEMKLSWGVSGYITEALRQVFRYPFQGFCCRTEVGRTVLPRSPPSSEPAIMGDGFTLHLTHASLMTGSLCAFSKAIIALATSFTQAWSWRTNTSTSAMWNLWKRVSSAAPPGLPAKPSASNSTASWWGHSRQHSKSCQMHLPCWFHDSKLEIGNWRLEDRKWKMQTGECKQGSVRWEVETGE